MTMTGENLRVLNPAHCEGCIPDIDYGHHEWPCDTVRLVMRHLGHPAPERVAW